MNTGIFSLLLGPIRLSLFFLFIFLVFRLVSLRVSDQTGLDYFIPRFTLALSQVVVISFILTQVNAFDAMVFLFILAVFIFKTFLNINHKKNLLPQVNKIYNRLILYAVKRSEKNENFLTRRNYRNKIKRTPTHFTRFNHRRWQYITGSLLALATFLSRLFFSRYDSYTLSNIWNRDLLNIISVSNNEWFVDNSTMMGDYAIIKIYSWISGISDPAALESIGILESVALSLIIYWAVYRLTRENYIPALLSSLSFIFLYPLLPLNLDLITQHKTVFMALVAGLPAILFIIRPDIFRKKSRDYLWAVSIIFFAVFLIDLFVALIIIPPFICLALLAGFFHHKRHLFRGVLAYFLALTVFMLVYGIQGLIMGGNLRQFFISNLYSITTYTYTPHLLLPLDDLIIVYRWFVALLFVPLIILYTYNRRKWFPLMMVAAYVFLLTLLYKFAFIDNDLLTQVIAVFIPLTLGISAYVLVKIIPFLNARRLAPAFQFIISVSLILVVFRASGGQKISAIPYERNVIKDQILNVYKRFDQKLLPLSYAVVNQRASHVYSTSHRNFIDYEYFVKDYMIQDLLYFRNIYNEAFLRENPEINLPNSTFVFLYKKGINTTAEFEVDWEMQDEVERSLEILRRRGREMSIFYDSSQLMVVELINKPNSSRIEELLLN